MFKKSMILVVTAAMFFTSMISVSAADLSDISDLTPSFTPTMVSLGSLDLSENDLIGAALGTPLQGFVTPSGDVPQYSIFRIDSTKEAQGSSKSLVGKLVIIVDEVQDSKPINIRYKAYGSAAGYATKVPGSAFVLDDGKFISVSDFYALGNNGANYPRFLDSDFLLARFRTIAYNHSVINVSIITLAYATIEDFNGVLFTDYNHNRLETFEKVIFTQEEEPPVDIPGLLDGIISGLVNGLKFVFEAAVAPIIALIDLVLVAVNGIGTAIGSLFDMVGSFFTFIYDLLIPETKWSDVVDLFTDFLDSMGSLLAILFMPFRYLIDMFTALITAPAATEIHFGTVDVFGFTLPVYMDFSMFLSSTFAPVRVGIQMISGAFLSLGILAYLKRIYFRFIDDDGGDSK